VKRLPTIIKKGDSQKQITFRLNLLEATVSGGSDSAGFSVKFYVQEKLGLKKQQSKQSKTVSNTRNPKWNESFAFYFESTKNVEIHVEVLEEYKGKSTVIGKFRIPPQQYSADTKKEIKQKGHQDNRGDVMFSGEIFPGNIVSKLQSEGCK